MVGVITSWDILAHPVAIRSRVRWMFRADENFSEFWRLCRGHGVLRHCKAIGNYAANHLLMLLGHYDQIPCDSEVRAYLGVSPKAPQREVERVAAKRYGHWGRFAYLAYKFERVFAKDNYVDCE